VLEDAPCRSAAQRAANPAFSVHSATGTGGNSPLYLDSRAVLRLPLAGTPTLPSCPMPAPAHPPARPRPPPRMLRSSRIIEPTAPPPAGKYVTGDINEAYLRNLEESGRGKRRKGMGKKHKPPAAVYLGSNKFATAA
jgi:hypothetical protein